MKVAVATGNLGKLREIRAILAAEPYDLIDARAFAAWSPPPEDAPDYLSNAHAKARSLAAVAGIPAIADDSGIEADALGGAPGARSARYAGENASDEDNLDALLRALAHVADTERGGRFRCVAVCATPGGRSVHAEATVEGMILRERRGSGGFGYDPIFLPDGFDLTTAEMDAGAKDAISHRGRAFRALAPKMGELLGVK